MELTHTVSQAERGDSESWYAHMVGFPNIPVFYQGGTFGTKKHALKIAALSNGLPYKDYTELRKTSKKK